MGSIHMPTAILAGKLGGSSDNGTDLVIPTFTLNVNDNDAECDMMYSDVRNAVETGKCICAKVKLFGDGYNFMQLDYYDDSILSFSYISVAEVNPLITPKQVFKSWVYFRESGITANIETESESIPVITEDTK